MKIATWNAERLRHKKLLGEMLHSVDEVNADILVLTETDHYGRQIPKQAHGSINLDEHTSSTRKIMCAVSELFDRIVDKNLLVRRMYVVANHVLPQAEAPKKNDGAVQLDLFTDYAAEEEKQKAEDAALERERKIQAATLAIKKKYGKNAILKAMNLEEGATAKDRNAQIGGHKA